MGDLKGPEQTLVKQLMRRKTRDVTPVHQDASRCGFMNPGNDVKQRGFPGAIGADKPGDRPFGDL